MSATPDLRDCLVGFRAFRLSPADGVLWPLADTGAPPWRPGVNVAVHAVEGPCHDSPLATPPHEAPDPDCHCGVNAFHDPWHPDLGALDLVIGAVACWGRVDVYADGLRASHAALTALGRPLHGSRIEVAGVERAARRYAVPLVDERDLGLEALRHGVPAPDDLRPQYEPEPSEEPRTAFAAPYHLRLQRAGYGLDVYAGPLLLESAGQPWTVRFMSPPGTVLEPGGWIAIIEGAEQRLAVCAPAEADVASINRRLIHDPARLRDEPICTLAGVEDLDRRALWGAAGDRLAEDVVALADAGVDVLATVRVNDAGRLDLDLDWWVEPVRARRWGRGPLFATAGDAHRMIVSPLAGLLEAPAAPPPPCGPVTITLTRPAVQIAVVSVSGGAGVLVDPLEVQAVDPVARFELDASLAFEYLTGAPAGFARRFMQAADLRGDVHQAQQFLWWLEELLPIDPPRHHPGQLRLPVRLPA